MFKFPLKSVYDLYRQLIVNPQYRWWVIGATLAYLVSPIDIAPDIIPFVGEIDDAIVVSMLVTELVGLLRDRMATESQDPTPMDVATTPIDIAPTDVIEAVAVEVV